MKLKSLLLLAVTALAFVSCGTSTITERKAVPPSGSVEGDMPWNTPQAGEGGGALGGMMNQGR